jgi:hypothetical protein
MKPSRDNFAITRNKDRENITTSSLLIPELLLVTHTNYFVAAGLSGDISLSHTHTQDTSVLLLSVHVSQESNTTNTSPNAHKNAYIDHLPITSHTLVTTMQDSQVPGVMMPDLATRPTVLGGECPVRTTPHQVFRGVPSPVIGPDRFFMCETFIRQHTSAYVGIRLRLCHRGPLVKRNTRPNPCPHLSNVPALLWTSLQRNGLFERLCLL